MGKAKGRPRIIDARAIGTTSEALVLARLVELGYGVSLPFGGALRYDLVVDDGGELSRAQVKTGRLQDNKITFPVRSTHLADDNRRSYVGDADVFIIYCPELNEIYRIDVEACGDVSKAYLWVSNPKRKTGRPVLNWAKEHVFVESVYAKRLAPLKACATVHPDTPSRMSESWSAGTRRRYCKECNLIWGRQARAKQREAKGAA